MASSNRSQVAAAPGTSSSGVHQRVPEHDGDEEEIEEETFWETRKYDLLEQKDRFVDFAWDPVNRTVLGRDKKSWGEIGIFYFIFYLCLAGFWIAALILFLETVPEQVPKYTNLIDRPGLNPAATKMSVSVGGLNANLKSANAAFLEGSFYNVTNTTEMSILNSGLASGCNLDEMSRDRTICMYIAVNRVYEWAPDTSSLDITCKYKTESLRIKTGETTEAYSMGSAAFNIVHNFFPRELFLGDHVHSFTTANKKANIYRNPVTIVVFPNYPNGTLGTVSLICSGKSEQLDTEAKFELTLE
eukprot:scpid68238/ scgid15917/ Sodium/potassium-transporting ATPase subunit beta-1; Sodium/potassium-dependent ATPase subunit beta-1